MNGFHRCLELVICRCMFDLMTSIVVLVKDAIKCLVDSVCLFIFEIGGTLIVKVFGHGH